MINILDRAHFTLVNFDQVQWRGGRLPGWDARYACSIPAGQMFADLGMAVAIVLVVSDIHARHRHPSVGPTGVRQD